VNILGSGGKRPVDTANPKATSFLDDGAKTTLKLKRKSDNKKLKKAVKGGAKATAKVKVKVKVKVKFTDEAGNTNNVKRNVKLQ